MGVFNFWGVYISETAATAIARSDKEIIRTDTTANPQGTRKEPKN